MSSSSTIFSSLPPGAPPNTPMHLFHSAYQHAKRIEAMENGTLPQIKQFSPSMCSHCDKMSYSSPKPLVCSGCRALVYCSRQCQVSDWKSGKTPHKLWCARDKEYMKRHTYFRSQFKQFPWARIEWDGTFSHRVFEARLGVYGPGTQFGFWSVPASRDSHDVEEQPHPEDYIHGEMMLGTEWPSDIDAWKLAHMNAKGDIIPRLSFTSEFPPPPQVEPGQIKDWQSWYSWRGLSMASPASLLMHYPLSIYHILVDVLQIAKCRNISAGRQAVHIHYIGTEKELNQLPLFSELALLLPCTDITLIMFGKPVFDLVKKARKSHPDSLATQDIVWSYTAPSATGGGSLEIKLYSKSEYWTDDVLKELKPDALVGLNAGLRTYPSLWKKPVVASLSLNIPFGITDYDEHGSNRIAEDPLARLDAMIAGSHGLARAAPRTFPVTPNPFHMPGQRPVAASKMPSLCNGFVTPVVRSEEAKFEGVAS